MYNTVVTIPRITTENIIELKSIVPNLDKLVTIPVTENEAQAQILATQKLTATLADPSYRYEYIRSVDSVTLNEDGNEWAVSFTIAGD